MTRAARRRFPLTVLAALLILLIAGLAGANLWGLVSLYERISRSAVTLSVLQYGTLLARQLSGQPFLQAARPAPTDEERFGAAVDWLGRIEPGLASITVTEGDVVLYHRETGAGPADTSGRPADAEPTRVIPKKLQVGDGVVPVLAFSRKFRGEDGRERQLQVTLKKEIVEREQAGPASAIAAMFNLSLATLGAAFGLCLLAVLWLVRREVKWEQRRRQDENLAFAGAVASSVIHDFRNAMNPMRLDAQLLQQETARGGDARPERLNDLAERITDTIGRLDVLLLEYLLVAKPEAVEQEPFDLNACLRDNADLLKTQFEKKGIRIALDLEARPLIARGYPVQFTRALLNILNNAEHFSPPGGVVSVRTRAGNGGASVEIADEGPGIPPRDRRRVFDLFYSRRPGGTGIGLALAKTAVENCGGAIAVGPGPDGKGSRFVIRVPLAP